MRPWPANPIHLISTLRKLNQGGRRTWKSVLLASVFWTSSLLASVEDFEFASGTICASPGFIVSGPAEGPTILCFADFGPRNKLGGPEILEELRDLPLIAGRLIVVPRLEMPDADRFEIVKRDVFPVKKGDTIALEAAQAIWNEIEHLQPEALIQMSWSGRIRAASLEKTDYGNTVLLGVTEGSRALGEAGVDAVNLTLGDSTQHWLPVPDPKFGLLVRSVSVLNIDALVLLPSSFVPREERRTQLMIMLRAMLVSRGMLSP